MAQAQLTCNVQGFETVQWSPISKQVECVLDSNFSIIVKNTKGGIDVVLKKGYRCIKMDLEIFEAMCDVKESVQLVHSFVEGNTRISPNKTSV